MKKAFAWLEGKDIEYQFHDYKKLGAPTDRIHAWIKQAGWERIVNTRGTTFRKLPTSRQNALNAETAAALLVDFPSAIKRPLLETGNSLLVGFDADEYAKTLR
jgi:arsenate reductase (glutaredoxin)